MSAKALKLHQWMIDPQRAVAVMPTDGGYSLSWNTAQGDRLSVIDENLEAVLVRACSLESDACNRETLLRMTFMPTTEIKAWTTGILYNGHYGWWGWVKVASPMPADAKFRAPSLPKGWKWDSSSQIKRHFKPSGVFGYLSDGDEIGKNVIQGGVFRFKVSATHSIFTGKDSVLDVINKAVSEFERAHFIIS